MRTKHSSPSFFIRSLRIVALALSLTTVPIAGCSSGGGGDKNDDPLPPVEDIGAATRGFRLFYRERMDRALVAFNRFALVGDSGFATTMGRSAVARDGNRFEVVPGPVDNNRIGTSAFAAYQAYKLFRSRPLALTLIRMFEGLAFVEAVSGHPGLTAREALPGWTRVMDGPGGAVTRTRDGAPVTHPAPPPAAIEKEVLERFFDGVVFTYRENPAEFFFSFKPRADLEDYAITYSFDELPRYVRVSDCCSSFMRTPEGYPWAGAFWGNHNSRDNLPDFALGFVAALECAGDGRADTDLRAAARHALDAGRRIGDSVWENGGALMTVGERTPYEDLIVAGAVRPDGVVEPQDLGSLSECPRAYAARAISSDGLRLPYPSLPLPGALELLLAKQLGPLIGVFNNCAIPAEGSSVCTSPAQAYCGFTLQELPRMEILGFPWLDLIKAVDLFAPGTAAGILGGFQDDWEETAWATLALVQYARAAGQGALEESARETLQAQTGLLRRFAEMSWARSDPAHLARQRYVASLLDATAGLEAPLEDFSDFGIAEQKVAAIENLLGLADTKPWPLLTDEEIKQRVERVLASFDRFDVVRRERYRAAYGEDPPLRRTADGYEARTAEGPFRTVENPHHENVGGFELLDEVGLCLYAPHILDCTWAALGCAGADLVRDGVVDSKDRQRFAELTASAGPSCSARNGWCGGADLDRTGFLDQRDHAFLDAAEGCTYSE